MFEKATRMKLRFKVGNGNATVEDLWDLSLTALDGVAKELYKEVKDEEISFIKKTRKKVVPSLKLDIVKHIIEVRLGEEKKAEEAAIARDKKQQILAILEEKENDSLKSASTKDLKKMLKDL